MNQKMSFLQKRIMAAKLAKVQNAIHNANSEFTVGKDAYVEQALNILQDCINTLNNQEV